MSALLVLALVAAIVVAMERTHRRSTASGPQLPSHADRDGDRVRADLAALSPATEAAHRRTAKAVANAHTRWVVLR
ncbi:hypothetical protein [Luteipulveratus mongoliensis]|uniref:Uncharacterized protein n=1 Tax=Luteipulveratus mongoliensis TaxID=571913 RepID=A0A0K1JF91_9MICO|nr:hypothetical protein [Luteipulveratus mongoliensis]AKU15243.1 hypothetical protein VV02_04170 [Luteipulveratus mongoliensis]